MKGATRSDEREPRTGAEWVALAGSCAVLGVLVLLVVLQLIGAQDPAAPTVQSIGESRAVGDLHHVEVTVRNEGDETAEAVQVTAALVVDDETTEGDQTIDFLAGGEEVDLVFVFAEDPGDGDLTVEVSGFTVP